MVTCHLQEIDPINGGEKEGKEKNRHPSLFFSLSIFIPLFFVIPPSFLSLPSQFILDQENVALFSFSAGFRIVSKESRSVSEK